MTEPNRPRLCECGCGRATALVSANHTASGAVKGERRRFIHGHQAVGQLAHNWRGPGVGYRALHTWLNTHHPRTGACEECGCTDRRTEYALIHGREHSRNRDNYRELCKSCHNAYDQIGGSRWRGVTTAKDRAGPDPGCRCGCGCPAGWDHKHARWRAYAVGHR